MRTHWSTLWLTRFQRCKRLDLATPAAIRDPLVDTLADMLAEVEMVTLGYTRSDTHTLVDILADTLAEVEMVTLGYTRSDAQALGDTLAVTLAEF